MTAHQNNYPAMLAAPAPHQPSTANEWRDRLKLRWTELAQISGHSLLAEDQIDKFFARLLTVTSHVNGDHSAVVFMGLKMNVATVAELLLYFVVETPGKPLPDKLDVLQLLEQCVDSRFNVYFGKKFNGLPTSEQNSIAYRQAYEHHHMQAALLERLSQDDYFGLVNHAPIFFELYVELIQIIGNERECFVQSWVNGNPEFTDSVFANYFFAKWLAGHFAENVAFLKRIFSARRSVARYLFNRILARGCDLHVAVLHDDVAGVRRLLEDEGVDADRRDAAGRTALHVAAAREMSPETLKANNEIVELLINHTLDIDVEDVLFAGSPLLYAEMAHSWSAINKLLRCKADTQHLPSTTANPASAAMLDAIFEHDLDSLMAFCLDKGLSVEYETEFGRLLLWACSNDCPRVLTLLISRGANIGDFDDEYETPLVRASEGGCLAIVNLLVMNAKLAAHLEASQHAIAYVNYESFDLTALEAAIMSNHVDVVAYLINEGADVWKENSDTGETPLHLATRMTPRMAAILIGAVDAARRAEFVNVTDILGRTALHRAAENDCVEMVRLLHGAGSLLTARDLKRITPLMVAVEEKSEFIVRYLIENWLGEDGQLKSKYVNAYDYRGRTAIHFAVLSESLALVRLLHEAGGLFSVRTNLGTTPLMLAAKLGREDVVQYIVDSFEGSDGLLQEYVNYCNENGKTAIHDAVDSGKLCIVRLLHKAGGLLTAFTSRGKTPLMIAVRMNSEDVVKYIIESFEGGDGQLKAKNINACDNQGKNAIHCAILCKRLDLVRLLHEAGGLLSACNYKGRTPLMTAAKLGCEDVVKYIIDNYGGGDGQLKLKQEYVNAKDNKGVSALYLAASFGHTHILSVLIGQGARVDCENNTGETPVQVATAHGHEGCVEILLGAGGV